MAEINWERVHAMRWHIFETVKREGHCDVGTLTLLETFPYEAPHPMSREAIGTSDSRPAPTSVQQIEIFCAANGMKSEEIVPETNEGALSPVTRFTKA